MVRDFLCFFPDDNAAKPIPGVSRIIKQRRTLFNIIGFFNRLARL